MNIAVSGCLLGYDLKYNGKNNRNDELLEILRGHRIISVCPEVSGGLPIPRDPAERKGDRVISCTGADVTGQYRKGTELAVRKIMDNGVKMAVLKAKSPSCGKDRIYDGTFSHTVISGDGTLAEALKAMGITVFSEKETEEIRAYLAFNDTAGNGTI